MKKQSSWILLLLSITVVFTTLSWISIDKSHSLSNVYTSNTSNISKTTRVANVEEQFEQYVTGIYNTAELGKTQLDYSVFKKALIGYINLKNSEQLSEKQLLTIVDFNKSSSLKRLWIIDLAQQKLLYNTLVAHGQGSGLDMANKFSNIENSHQSSLGFYITSDIYAGKHGRSIRLDGMDKDFNSNAKNRAVVIHGAKYVSQQFIDQTGRLGRSHGCPALPVELTNQIINNIKGRTCLFIAGPQKNYVSEYINQDLAINSFLVAKAKAPTL